MKAREKNTGKEITILGISKEWGTATYIEDGILRQKNLSGEWEIIDESESVDWSSFRRETAMDILCALVGNKDYLKVIGRIEPETTLAIRFADELIKQIKQE